MAYLFSFGRALHGVTSLAAGRCLCDGAALSLGVAVDGDKNAAIIAATFAESTAKAVMHFLTTVITNSGLFDGTFNDPIFSTSDKVFTVAQQEEEGYAETETLQRFRMCTFALDLLSAGVGEDDPLLAETYYWFNLVLNLIDIRIDLQTKADNLHILKLLSNLWATFENHPSVDASTLETKLFAADMALSLSQAVSKVQSTQRLKALICEFVSEVLADTAGRRGPFLLECQSRVAVLPQEVKDMVVSSQTVDKLKDLVTRVKQGKSPGTLVDLTSLEAAISQALHLHHVKSDDETYLELKKVLDGEWAQAFTHHVNKCTELSYVSVFNEKYAGLPKAVDAWSFEACPFLTNPATEEENILAKRIEAAVGQYDVWLSSSRKIAANIAWATESQRGDANRCVTSLEHMSDNLRQAASLLAQCALASVLIKPDTTPATVKVILKYTQEQLKVVESSLPAKMREHLASVATAGTAEASGPGGSSASQPSGPAKQARIRALSRR